MRDRSQMNPEQVAAALRWAGLRQLADLAIPSSPRIELVIGGGLQDDDWRVRMTAVLAVSRRRLAQLARSAAMAAIPQTDVGLRDGDRRVLLALRDIAVAFAQERPVQGLQPLHSNPEIAGKRARFLSQVLDFVEADVSPGPSNPVHLLRALSCPEAINLDQAPFEWRKWLNDRQGAPDLR
jgi:hypothetical protein